MTVVPRWLHIRRHRPPPRGHHQCSMDVANADDLREDLDPRSKLILLAAGSVMRAILVTAVAIAGLAATMATAPASQVAQAATSLPAVCASPGPRPHTSTVSARTLMGLETTIPAATALTRLDYGNGSDIVLPPDGWEPLSATDRELEVFAIPPRPSDPGGLQDWTDIWSHYRNTGNTDFCSSNVSAAIQTPNWSGKLDHCAAGYCKKASGVFYQPAFSDATCGAGATHFIWSGLGGVLPDGGLLQSGTFHVGSPSTYLFWEYLNRSHPNPPATVPAQIIWNGVVHVGDQIQPTTWHYLDSLTGTPRVSMSIFNVTTGANYPVGPFSTINGYPLSDYWSGLSAEYINERGLTASGYTYYSRPVGDSALWSSAYTNANAASSPTFIPEDIKMLSDDKARFLGYPGGFGSGASFSNHWQYCR